MYKISSHPLNDRKAIEASIREGNASIFLQQPPRDQSLREKEYWETRPYPANIAHWTEDEFERFLEEHQFPGCTLRDRRAARLQAIRKALVKGEYIPREVMADAVTINAVTDAIMDVGCAFAHYRAHDDQNKVVKLFESDVKFSIGPVEDFESRMDELFVQAANADKELAYGGRIYVTGSLKRIQPTWASFPLIFAYMTPEDYNRHHMKKFWVDVRDGREHSQYSYGSVVRIEVWDVESRFRRLIKDGRVVLAAVQSVLGWMWTPYSRVTVVHSAENDLVAR